MLKTNWTIALVALVGLGACGGSGTNAVPLSTLTDRAEAFGLNSENEEINFLDVELTPNANLRTVGSAKYTGISFVISTNPDTSEIDAVALGSAEVSANFETGTVSGSANNFFELENAQGEASDITDLSDVRGESITGSISYNLTQPFRGANAFQGTASGSVALSTGTVSVDGSVVGGFTGVNSENIAIVPDPGRVGANPIFGVIASQD